MKQKVIKFLQNLPKEKYDQFNEAFELYRKSEGKNFGMERSINASGFSERGLENLLYDLQKLHGITDVEKVSVQLSVVNDKYPEDIEHKKWSSLDPDINELFKVVLKMTDEQRNAWAVDRQKQFGDFDSLLQLSFITELEEVSDCLTKVWEYLSQPISTNENQEAKGVEGIRSDDSHPGSAINDIDVNTLIEVNENLASDNEDLLNEKADLEEELEASTEEVETLKEQIQDLKSLPKIDAKSIRVEFPFLNEKDCPDEFKILVADKITAWNRYLEKQERISAAERGEAPQGDYLAEFAKEAVQAFDENQKIYDELNAYQTTGKVLGFHPIFRRLQLTREVEEMTAEELVKYKSSSAKYFTDNRKSLAKAEKEKGLMRIIEIKARVEDREVKLALVNKKLGINPK